MFSVDNTSPPWNNSEQMENSSASSESHINFDADSTSNSTNTSNSSNTNTSNSSNTNTTQDSESGVYRSFVYPRQDSVSEVDQQDSVVELAAGGVASTPRVIRAQRNRHIDRNQPIVDLVNISNFEAAAASSRVRTARVDRFVPSIDLCTPPRVTAFINLSEYGDPPSTNARRGRRREAGQEEIVVTDISVEDGPSPTKRSCDRNNITTEDVYKCPVCLDTVRQNEPCTTRCGHVFCKECITSAVRTTKKCPLCNKRITLRQLLRIYI